MKWFRLYSRLRYWKRRAIKAETQLITSSADAERRLLETQIQAQAEAYRNREREDTFVSAAVLGGRGMVGIPPRSGAAETPQAHRLVSAPDPWTALTYAERDEFEKQWLVDAVTHGYSAQQAKNDFLQELAKRKAFNDEPSM